jgi:hypothetical protein
MDEDPKEPIFNDAEVEKILREALKDKIVERKKLPNKVQLNNALAGSMGEFLSCFKLIGYDLDGNPVNLSYSKTKMQKSALDNAFMQEIGVFMESRMM